MVVRRGEMGGGREKKGGEKLWCLERGEWKWVER